jgi:hypothetical protein
LNFGQPSESLRQLHGAAECSFQARRPRTCQFKIYAEKPEMARVAPPVRRYARLFRVEGRRRLLIATGARRTVYRCGAAAAQGGRHRRYLVKGVSQPTMKILRNNDTFCLAFPLHPKSEVVFPIYFDQLNPPKQFMVPADKVECIARVHSVMDSGSTKPKRLRRKRGR